MTYPYNVRIDVGGVTFTGPGMETESSAEGIKSLLEEYDDVSHVEVFQQTR